MSITGSSVQSAENIICPSGKSAHSSLSQFTFVFVCCSAFASLLDSSSPHTFQHSKPALQHSNIPSFHLGFFSAGHICQGKRGEGSYLQTCRQWPLWVLRRPDSWKPFWSGFGMRSQRWWHLLQLFPQAPQPQLGMEKNSSRSVGFSTL